MLCTVSDAAHTRKHKHKRTMRAGEVTQRFFLSHVTHTYQESSRSASYVSYTYITGEVTKRFCLSCIRQIFIGPQNSLTISFDVIRQRPYKLMFHSPGLRP